MPRAPLHTLTWSAEQNLYAWSTHGQVVRRFPPTDEAAWLAWLGEVTSFAFHSPSGSLNVYQERRARGGRYWYAYHTDRYGIRKRYLGPTTRVTLARLVQTAHALASVPSPVLPASLFQHDDPLLLPLDTKLTPPRLPGMLVPRERLLVALDAALTTPLTLVSAAAGWGKTTLLSAWAQRREPITWLALSAHCPTRYVDRDFAR
jgi:hypothetical protein